MRSMVEGDRYKGHPAWKPPLRQAFGLPPPRAGGIAFAPLSLRSGKIPLEQSRASRIVLIDGTRNAIGG